MQTGCRKRQVGFWGEGESVERDSTVVGRALGIWSACTAALFGGLGRQVEEGGGPTDTNADSE